MPAAAVVLPLVRRVDAHARLELDGSPSSGVAVTFSVRAPSSSGSRSKRSKPRQPERLDRLAVRELQRQHAHADQVGAVDALVGLGDHEAHAQQARPLGRPVARGARAVLLAGQHAQRHALVGVVHRGVVDRRLLAVLDGEAALGPGRELVAQADVGERAAHHHLVVAAPRAVGVEVALLHAVLDQVARRRASPS